ncbi:MAG TPA: hypothetical protein VHX38_00430 [Pseudonocardiaceae bacterium]|jgi:hypothetical protein|nr:hypothetical protein [Pseudonocardiaceae bacterium]
MFEEFRPASSTGSPHVRWFHELVDESATASSTKDHFADDLADDGALGWFPASGGFPARALVIPGPRRPAAEY